jgi:hypothetical protein
MKGVKGISLTELPVESFSLPITINSLSFRDRQISSMPYG